MNLNLEKKLISLVKKSLIEDRALSDITSDLTIDKNKEI